MAGGAYGAEAWGGWIEDEDDIEDQAGPTLAYLEMLEEEFIDWFYAASFGDNCE
jgi:hypothetical protein